MERTRKNSQNSGSYVELWPLWSYWTSQPDRNSLTKVLCKQKNIRVNAWGPLRQGRNALTLAVMALTFAFWTMLLLHSH